MSRNLGILTAPIWKENPIFFHVLGVCSALAVTTRVSNALVMGAAVMVTAVATGGFVSLLRPVVHRSVRLLVEMLVIATFVILFDVFLKAFAYPMSRQLGPYVGLIVTNCILLGRAEAFALKNPVWPSMLDGLGSGLGYSWVLVAVAVFREALGAGTLLGFRVLPDGAQPAQAIFLPPGAFFLMGIFVWVLYEVRRRSR
ncbi:NADH:ubiquinone reductase (Na(+)-transporting) subunit D [Myxococcota bacterium]|nr:NADH:ubiquinone reductase (Na(+)-transporting) subunit D [Myxococcota bacterium]